MRGNIFTTVLVALASAFAAVALAGELSVEAGRKLDPKLRAVLAAPNFSQTALRKNAALVEQGSNAFVRVLIQTTAGREALQANGARVMSMAGDIVSATVPLARLAAIAERNDVHYIAASQSYRLFNDVGVAQTQATAARQQYNVTGKNVIFGCIDSGIDWRHDDFRKATGQTRIKYLLDFSDPGDTNGDGDLDGAGPYGGTLYTEAQINAALNNTGTVKEADRNGHGTHVTGSAAGNGRGTSNNIPAGTYAGVATEADIIFIKSSRGDLGNIPDIEIINALAFVDSLAKVLNKTYVVNLSLGGHEGAHDGTSLQEQALDSFV
ncbi:MAG: S8 family serine peptidase, partial [candidate division KSB1 bacterium]